MKNENVYKLLIIFVIFLFFKKSISIVIEAKFPTYNDLDKLYELISKHLIRSREDNDMCDYEIEKMRLENERMKLSLLEKRVLTYDQMKEMFGNSIL